MEKPKEWLEIDLKDLDKEPLSEQELQQLNSKEGYVSSEEAKELGIQVDLP